LIVDYAAALVVRDDRVLMGYRSPAKRAWPCKWDSIGGKVESGETIAQALIRELQEEIGVTPTDWRLIEIVSGIESGDSLSFNLHIHAVMKWEGGEPLMLGDEHSKIAWHSLEELRVLPDLLTRDYVRLAELALE
jgi:8-oxo-dGTP diphosphatase